MPTPIFPDLKDASVFITGGGSGIGAALTDGFLGQGAQVVFIDRITPPNIVTSWRQGTGVARCSCRATSPTPRGAQGAIADAAEAHGPVTVLVSGAAAPEFPTFLRRIDRAVRKAREVYLVLDNDAIHKTPEVRDWLEKHPRFIPATIGPNFT